MSALLVAYLGVLLVPLFVASWRTSLLGLSGQGLLLAWIAYRLDPGMDSPVAWLTLFDTLVVRGLAAPMALHLVLRAQRAPARNDVIPPNLLGWTAAFGMVLVAFHFADQVSTEPGDARMMVAVAAAGALIGLLVLATQARAVSQMIGALCVENAIALFELGGEHDGSVLGVRIAQTALVIITVAMFRWYLRTLPLDGAPEPVTEGPTL